MSHVFLEARAFNEPWPHQRQRPEGEWIRLIPTYIQHPVEISARRRESDGGYIYLDEVYDIKLFGFGHLWGCGPNLLVSRAFREIWDGAGYHGVEFAEPPHATPYAPRVDRPWLCRPVRYAPAVCDRVRIVPASRRPGRGYGSPGRPVEPLEVCVPPLPEKTALGGPWFATSSLPFQPLIVPATFLERFEAETGSADLAWAPCRLIEPPEH